ncbi:cache domain-containing protein [Roseateles sp.]|uniref:cache domain-containing protein n=1 Tax=Roseateles sp. TaxID=1971397 RepID=UPI00286BC022|nr:cache domain-containing protein [Roseateles sp.]
MNLRLKLMLVTSLPLLLAFSLTAWVLRVQQNKLTERQQTLVRDAYSQATRSELRHQVALALSTISPLYNTGRDDDDIKRLAVQQLVNLDYGPDGYFFLYDYKGVSLMHPRQPELVGRNLMEMRDAQGRPAIRLMIERAIAGGGFIEYTWSKPSANEQRPKIAYVTGLERWQWMIGTGIYTDEVDKIQRQLADQLTASLGTTLRWVGLTTLVAATLMLVSVLGLSISELRSADAKLTLLARRLVRSQEDERAWLSRELHDGTSQTLVAAKLLTESALARLPADAGSARTMLERAMARIADALDGVRGISHRLRPVTLDTLGLTSALRQLGEDSCSAAGLAFSFEVTGNEPHGLPAEVRTTLFRVAQEALANALKHAQASHVQMLLHKGGAEIRLTVQDNGQGFSAEAIDRSPKQGIGLRNMRERMNNVGGRLELSSDEHGTKVEATIPRLAVQRLAQAA